MPLRKRPDSSNFWQVLSVDLGQPFPKKKERKASAAEGYVPVSFPLRLLLGSHCSQSLTVLWQSGIIKNYWLSKHTSQLPAVMAVR